MRLSLGYGVHGELEDSIWSLVAWLGRYGRQPFTAVLDLTVAEMTRLADKVGEFLEKESPDMTGND